MAPRRKYDEVPDKCDWSKGIPQCRIVYLSGDMETHYYCCRRDGHEGVHIDGYGYEFPEGRPLGTVDENYHITMDDE